METRLQGFALSENPLSPTVLFTPQELDALLGFSLPRVLLLPAVECVSALLPSRASRLSALKRCTSGYYQTGSPTALLDAAVPFEASHLLMSPDRTKALSTLAYFLTPEFARPYGQLVNSGSGREHFLPEPVRNVFRWQR